MTQINFDIPEEEDVKVIEFSKKWNLNKPKTILKMIRTYTEKEVEVINNEFS